jgi:hypothetical protein
VFGLIFFHRASSLLASHVLPNEEIWEAGRPAGQFKLLILLVQLGGLEPPTS